MSEIDWDRPLEAYHEDGRCAPVTVLDRWKGYIHCDAMPQDGDWWFSDDGSTVPAGWRIRNVTEPKADIEAWAYSIVSDLDQAEREGMQSYARLWDAFARYVMTKEEAPVDPDLIAAREVVCGYHHDKYPENPWHIEMAEQVRSGARDDSLVMLAAYNGIKRGRELERGEAK